MKGELESGVSAALERGSAVALVALAFMAVLREGLETVLFLLAVLGSTGDVATAMLFAVLGLVVAVAIGVAIFALGVRIDLRRFFTLTGFVLIFVAAGLCAYAVHELTGAGWLPPTPVAFDLTTWVPDTGLRRLCPGRTLRLSLSADVVRGHRLLRLPRPRPRALPGSRRSRCRAAATWRPRAVLTDGAHGGVRAVQAVSRAASRRGTRRGWSRPAA